MNMAMWRRSLSPMALARWLALWAPLVIANIWANAWGDVRAADQALMLTMPTDSYPGLEHVSQITRRVYSGGQPKGRQAFEALKALGVTTVVSVDGLPPDVDEAHRAGIRYVHLPMGYDGVPDNVGRALARVAREARGTIYVHCHHGKHRGPAAAAVLCQAMGDADAKGSLKILKVAGTGEEYRGLWRDVARYEPPKPGQQLPELLESAPVDSLAAIMAQLDRNWDQAKALDTNGWQPTKEQPAARPDETLALVEEAFREAERSKPEADYGEEFGQQLQESLRTAIALRAAVKRPDAKAAGALVNQMTKSCKACHAKFRD